MTEFELVLLFYLLLLLLFHRINIFLSSHESVDDLFKTIQHELVHHCIDLCDEDMDEDQEEKLIFLMAWAEEAL